MIRLDKKKFPGVDDLWKYKRSWKSYPRLPSMTSHVHQVAAHGKIQQEASVAALQAVYVTAGRLTDDVFRC
jgi:uncharacterized protein YciW